MNIKELLLEGCIISFPFKERKKDWVSTATINIYSGIGSKPKVCCNIACKDGDIRWSLDKLDEAIEFYTSKVFNPKNLQYKMNETLRELNEAEDFVDLENDKDYRRVRSIIKKKLNGRKRK